MKRGIGKLLFPTAMARRAYAVVLTATLLPAVIAVMFGATQFGSLERKVKQAHMSSICRLLQLQLDEAYTGFSGIAGDSALDESFALSTASKLNEALQPFADRIGKSYPRVEAGYYSRAAGAEVAGVGIDGLPLPIRQRPESEFRVYQTQRPDFSTDGRRLVQVMPVFDRGEIAGHVWAAIDAPDLTTLSASAASSMFATAGVTAIMLILSTWSLMRSVASWCESQSGKKTIQANEAAAAVVHELKNPIAVARGLTELIMSRETDTRKQMWLSNLMRQMDRMNSLASDYLTYTRPREPRMRPVPLGEVMGQLQMDVGHMVEQAGAELMVSISDPATEVICDPDQLGQILLNLVRNSLDAVERMPNGRKEISVNTSSIGSNRTEIVVTDNGIGILDEDMPNLFVPFFTSKQKGTGMGLAVSRRLAEQMGGGIRAERREHGARFILELRACRPNRAS